MDFKFNFNTKQFILGLFSFGAVMLIGGILVLALGVPHAVGGFYKVMLGIIGVLMMLGGAVSVFLAVISRDTDPHFFRYSRQLGRNIPLEELTFDRINGCMTFFVQKLADSQERLWQGNVFADTPVEDFGTYEILRPVLAYKMLYDLAKTDRDETWELFNAADPALIDALTEALTNAGEDAMPRALQRAYNDAAGIHDIVWIRDFIMGNEKYIRRRMDSFVRSHDEYFY